MIIPVILSGGSGARLWPLSRQMHPKPFLKLPSGLSLLQKTFLRACEITTTNEILTITNREYFLKSKPEYEKSLLTSPKKIKQTFLLEPESRNTAAAIILAALHVLSHYGEETSLLILPADHLIEEVDQFIHASKKAQALAELGFLVTFGLPIVEPETGFGYIKCGETIENSDGFSVQQFIEKPSLAKAKQLMEEKNCFWNAGIFCFKVSTLFAEYEKHAQALLEQARDCWEISQHNMKEKNVYHLDPDSFQHLNKISIDYALLEKSDRTALIPCDFAWQDIGSWTAYKALHTPDREGNRVLGDAILVNSKNNLVLSESRMIATIGIDNLIIVDTPDALLIANETHAQDVKEVVETLKAKDHKSYYVHRRVERPWGNYTLLQENPGFIVKCIEINVGAAISLQKHTHRNEHWIIVAGIAKINHNEEEQIATRNDAIFIPKTHLHRIANIGEIPLVFIEVQIGDYLSEDDITRFEDLYGRE